MAIIHGTQGTVLKRNGATVLQLKSIGPIGVGRALRDVTTLSDSVHKHKKNIADVTEIACSVYYDPQDGVHIAIMTDDATAATSNWQILLEQGNSPGEVIDLGGCYVINSQIESLDVDSDATLTFSLKPQAVPVGLFDVI